MYNIVIARYGEIGVKGKNRYVFENRLIKNIKNNLKEFTKLRVYKDQARIYIDIEDNDYEEIIQQVKKVFGVVSVSPATKLEADYDLLKKSCLEMATEKVEFEGAKTFKVESKRTDKRFKLTSPQMSQDIGGYILSNLGDKLKVDVNNPDFVVYAEMREENAICYVDKFQGYGGLPIGTNGKAMVLLSGGIDSPVAAWLVAKRGVEIEAVHFHSYPFTSERSKEKVKDLARVLARYCGKVTMHSVNLLPIQKNINQNCPQEEMTILSRRFMMRIAQKIAKERNCTALITGESIGQVASQTLESLNVTNAVVDIPVFRPCIAMDKTDIVSLAKDIGTFEISIIPEEDCCTVFLPKNPVIRPKLEKIVGSELKLDVESLINEAIENMESERIEP
ncbi:thiamine biosynthesis protein ThiI [Alkalithermobacter thermoalcaliphilus JW-YL-7 = DSM 7308]|uniref:Probable tRNA sulfurtransferase n=1 Tax=Alkalithermobacter thermoalcaliphilus JW-YL-7 = DSM 7308 TaxID=1121328 RepID=A0A150FQ91_CLOPD|nr:tRNA sulfurtransferase [[Clostridium] paradoxum JW-YL-7 = DSM 7308]SHK54096.1 thiamine biosynthesis protein ThiI [[Clostridium] paradoxum JW-YL-7 = DSM 7308]